jgi:hypothetical protein
MRSVKKRKKKRKQRGKEEREYEKKGIFPYTEV